MARKKLFGTKGPLIYATMVSLVCVMAASISTFAWFQAEARVQVQTTSTSANITVSKPDSLQAAFFIYNNNGGTHTTSASTGSTGYASYWTQTVSSFAGSFTQLDGSTTPSNSASGLTVGKRLTYCVRVSGEENAGITGSHSLSISSVTDTGGLNRYLYDTTTTDTLVKLGWAINVYGTCIVTATNAVPAPSDIQTFIRADGTDMFLDSPDGESHSDAVASGTSATAKHFYFFYTIEISNDEGTYFQQVDSEGEDVVNSPLNNNSDTYWKQATTGDSEVYAGLTFAIAGISLV